MCFIIITLEIYQFKNNNKPVFIVVFANSVLLIGSLFIDRIFTIGDCKL